MPISGVRTAYGEGHTDVCIDDSGKFILTCGSDGDVRVFEGIDDIGTSYSLGEAGFAICSRGARFFVGSSSNLVQSYKLNDGSEEAVIASFGAEVTCLAASVDGTLIAAGSADFNLRIIHFGTDSGVVETTHTCVGHLGPVTSVAIDPKGKYVASSGCDGTVKIWDVETYACLKTIDNVVPKCNDFTLAKHLARLSFSPKTGAFLAVPHTKEIKLYNRDKWEIVGTLADPDVKDDVGLCAFSPCGTHIAAGYNDGMIVIYSFNSRKAVNTFKHPKQKRICGMQWSPIVSTSSLAYSDDHGHFALIEKAFVPGAEKQQEMFQPAKVSSKPVVVSTVTSIYSEEDSNHADPKKTSIGGGLDDIDTEDIFDDDLDLDSNVAAPPAREVVRAPAQPRTPMQEAFQPGSTPSFLQSSFMVWNDMGYMKMYEEENEFGELKRSIDVIYHNAAYHHSIQVFNTENFTLGTMNNKGFLLATQKPASSDESEAKSSKIQFNMVGATSDRDKWTLDLDKGEWVEGVALGDEWCYVATSKRMLRVISFSGYQQYILAYPGPLVAIVARQRLSMLTYHLSDPTFAGDQCMGFSMYCMGQRRVEVIVADQRLPLSPKATLSWLGFGFRSSPCCVDSSGIVRVYHYRNPLCKIWSPCLDLEAKQKNKSDKYFMVSLDEDSRSVRVFLCRGARYPPTLPLPVVILLPFDLLQADVNTDVEKLEAKCSLHRLFPPKNEQTLRACRSDILKMFALYCQNDSEGRAQDMTRLMPTARDMEACWKYADKTGKSALAERLEQMISAIIKDEEEEEVTPTSTIKLTSPPLFDDRTSAANDPLSKRTPVTRRPPIHKTIAAAAVTRNNLTSSLIDSDDDEEDFRSNSNLARHSNNKNDGVSNGTSYSRLSISAHSSSTKHTNNTGPQSKLSVGGRVVEDSEDSRSSIKSDEVLEDAPTSTQTFSFEPEPSLPPSTGSANPFAKPVEVAPLLRGISTMEEVTTQRSAAKVNNASNEKNPKKRTSVGKAGSGVEPAAKRGRGRKEKEANGEMKDSGKKKDDGVNAKKIVVPSLERFGFKSLGVKSSGKSAVKENVAEVEKESDLVENDIPLDMEY